MRSLTLSFFLFSLFTIAGNLYASDKKEGACYIKIYKTVGSPTGGQKLVEDMTCEPLSLKKCHQKANFMKMARQVDDCHVHSWVENEMCGR